MKKVELYNVSFEITRRCNIRCEGFCMRGDAQNFDMNKYMVDTFFDTKSRGYALDGIHHLCFTGGEPTLNPEIIIYTINKIIEENIPVYNITLMTNGQLFVPELVQVLNKYNKYMTLKTNKAIRDYCAENFGNSPKIIERMLKNVPSSYAQITFSTDRFHKLITEEVRKQYSECAEGIEITNFEVKDSDIIKSGFSKNGKELKKEDVLYKEANGNYRTIYNYVYMTAKGDILFGGDGSYQNIDNNVIGRVDEVSLFDVVETYGGKVLQR